LEVNHALSEELPVTADLTKSPVQQSEEPLVNSTKTGCVIVGGGPAGVMLAYLLARKGVAVTLLEGHKDFDRDFRGDTVHPSTLEILDQLGLADKALQIPHGKLHSLQLKTPAGMLNLGDIRRLHTKYPFVALIPQAEFLDFLANEGKKFPSFQLVLNANVQRLVQSNGVVQGVRYRSDDGWHEVLAPLTVAADGRFSKVRSLIGYEPVKTAPPMDIVWLRFPRKPSDPVEDVLIHIGAGHFAAILDRGDSWQIGYAILKGSFAKVKAAGIQALQQGVIELFPWLRDRILELNDWKHMTVLSVESSRLEKWFAPGLLLIGDAAHVMSPVGGVGINYAIQDAVEAANLLTDSLERGHVDVTELEAFQKLREPVIKTIQKLQSFLQERIAGRALQPGAPFRIPLPLRLISHIPILRNLPVKMIAFGPRHVRVKE
jgi:2-polyprenyl-6-methoxyphenol hydroxylase-like FAD-dependent oxidoreductase